MTDERMAEIKGIVTVSNIADLLATGPFARRNQEHLLEIADELLAEIEATVPFHEDVRIGKYAVPMERSWLGYLKHCADLDNWTAPSQKVLVSDCLEMIAIIEAHRKPTAPTPTQETPVAEPMTDGDLVFRVTQIARYREILARNAICWSDQATLVVYAEDLAREVRRLRAATDKGSPVTTPMTDEELAIHKSSVSSARASINRGEGYMTYDYVVEHAEELLAEVVRLRALTPANDVEVAVAALGAMLQGHLAGVATEVRDCLRMASDVCDAIEEKRDEPTMRLVDAGDVEERLQDILDALNDQDDNQQQQVYVAFEGILRLQGWIDGKTDHVLL